MDDDDEFAKLLRRMNPPRVVIDNNTSEDATVIQVDSVNKHGTLLEVVQVLTDMNLVIKKAYISSDAGWFMDVFKVIDQHANKITDIHILDYIQRYVVFHGMVSTEPVEAYQEFYIRRHVDGLPINSEAEQERVIKCLEAAIERRASEGLELELSVEDRVGLLSDITRTFRENSLTIVRAEISTREGKAKDTFYVTDVTGNTVESKIVESIRQEIGVSKLKVKKEEEEECSVLGTSRGSTMDYLISKAKSLQKFKLHS